MRKALFILIGLLVVATGLYLLLFEWVVPKAASLTVPGRWNMIPLRQTKDIVHNYLGEPFRQDANDGSEEWSGGSKGKMYFLRVYYVSDTLAAGYSIHYQYKNFLVSKNYLVDSFSIR